VIALKLEGNSVKLCAQVERLYSHLLYQFEQLYFYRRPEKLAFRSATNKGYPNSSIVVCHLSRCKTNSICHFTTSLIYGMFLAVSTQDISETFFFLFDVFATLWFLAY